MTDFTPKHQTKYSAGVDLVSQFTVEVPPRQMTLVSTGYCFSEEILKVAQEYNLVFMLHPRSSISYKKGLMLGNGVGVIDADYQDEIKVMFYNTNDFPVTLEVGERIAQLVPLAYITGLFEVKETERQGGFGSTKLK